jgi:hypothetical protein
MYKKIIGTRAEVVQNKAYKTSGGLKKEDLLHVRGGSRYRSLKKTQRKVTGNPRFKLRGQASGTVLRGTKLKLSAPATQALIRAEYNSLLEENRGMLAAHDEKMAAKRIVTAQRMADAMPKSDAYRVERRRRMDEREARVNDERTSRNLQAIDHAALRARQKQNRRPRKDPTRDRMRRLREGRMERAAQRGRA